MPAPFITRPATSADWRPLRLLLPDAVHYGCRCEMAVAMADSLVVAAAALDPVVRAQPHRGQRLALHVIPPWNGKGVEQSLIAWADAAAARHGSAALFTWHSLAPTSLAAESWRSLGFTHAHAHPHTQIDATATVAYLQAAQERLARRCQPPAGAQLIPLRQATADQRSAAIQLQLAQLGGDPQSVAARFDADFPDAGDPDLSHLLLLNQRVIGVALVRRTAPTTCFVQADVLDPIVRHGGWANLLLKLSPAQACLAAGIEIFIFETFYQHTDSRRFADKIGGVTLNRVELYRMIPAAR